MNLPHRIRFSVFASLCLLACGGRAHETIYNPTTGSGGSGGAAAGKGGSGTQSKGGATSGGASSAGGAVGEAGTNVGGDGAEMGGAAGEGGEGGAIGGSGGVGGVGGSGGDGGSAGVCNAVIESQQNATCSAFSGEPTPTGGVIPDGTYHLEAIAVSFDCLGFNPSEAFHIARTMPDTYEMQGVSDTPLHANSVWTTSGTQASSVFTCGSNGNFTWNYSVLNDMALPRLRLSDAVSIWTYVRVGN